jgi:mRNA interferase MazF
MRPIHAVRLDKVRPALVLTRSEVHQARTSVTVAAITSTRRGLSVELPVGPANGLDRESVVNLDATYTIAVDELGPQIGTLFQDQEPALAAAVFHAFGLDW